MRAATSGFGTFETCRDVRYSVAFGGKRTSLAPSILVAIDPGCVKTCTSRECAELFSLFSSFDCDCQTGSFLIQPNRDKLSTRKFDVGVFTQSGPKADNAAIRESGQPGSRPCLLMVGLAAGEVRNWTSAAVASAAVFPL
jgi:hypothetical protein